MLNTPDADAGPGSSWESPGEHPPVIDLNCDMGEGMDTDASGFLPFISSANIACGAHAGDDDTMRRTVALALKSGVVIGVHPSYPDRERFGRVDMLGEGLSLDDMALLFRGQLLRLQGVCSVAGTRIRHVKPHGALYEPGSAGRGCRQDDRARSWRSSTPSLFSMVSAGSEMRRAAHDAFGLRFVSEVFADRTYQPDGSLTPRTRKATIAPDR